jgi:hypothetical protein
VRVNAEGVIEKLKFLFRTGIKKGKLSAGGIVTKSDVKKEFLKNKFEGRVVVL